MSYLGFVFCVFGGDGQEMIRRLGCIGGWQSVLSILLTPQLKRQSNDRNDLAF